MFKILSSFHVPIFKSKRRPGAGPAQAACPPAEALVSLEKSQGSGGRGASAQTLLRGCRGPVRGCPWTGSGASPKASRPAFNTLSPSLFTCQKGENQFPAYESPISMKTNQA